MSHHEGNGEPGSEADGCYHDSINAGDSVKAPPLLTATLGAKKETDRGIDW